MDIIQLDNSVMDQKLLDANTAKFTEVKMIKTLLAFMSIWLMAKYFTPRMVKCSVQRLTESSYAGMTFMLPVAA